MNKTSLYIGAFTLLLIVVLYFVLKSVLLYIGIGFALAVIGRPLVELLEKIKIKKFKISRGLASMITLLSYFLLIFVLFSFLGPLFFTEIKALTKISPNEVIEALTPFIEKIETEVYSYTGTYIEIEQYINEKLASFFNLTRVSSWLNTVTVITGNIFVAFFAIAFITFFFLKDGARLISKFLGLFPKKYRDDFLEIQPEIKNKLTRYFIGICIEISIVFLCLVTGIWIIGIENFIIMALCAAVFNVIPYVGPVIGIAIGVTITITTNYSLELYTELLPLVLKVILVFIITQLIDNIFLQPYIYSNSVNAHPLEIFLVILIAGNIFGVLGMILAIPAYTVLRILFKEIRQSSSFFQKMYD